MAVPSDPADQTTGVAAPETWADAVNLQLSWLMNDRPYFKGRAYSAHGNGSYVLPDDTVTDFGFGIAGSFNDTPITNVGGWDVNGADANPESLVIPEAGIYMFTISAEFENPSGHVGRRAASLMVNDALVAGSESRIDAGDTAAEVAIPPFTVFHDCAVDQDVDVRLYQNSGAELDVIVYLTALWIQST